MAIITSVEKFTDPVFIKRLVYFIKKICEPQLKRSGMDVDLSLYGLKFERKNIFYTHREINELLPNESKIYCYIDADIKRNNFFNDERDDYNDEDLEVMLMDLFVERSEQILGSEFFMGQVDYDKKSNPKLIILANKRPKEPLEYTHNESMNESSENSNKNEPKTVYEKFINERYVNLFNNFLDKVVEPRLRKEIYATTKIKLKLYGISIRPKSNRYYNIPIEELTDSQAAVYFFIDINPNIIIKDTKLIEILYEMGGNILGLNYENFYNFIYKNETFKAQIEINQRPLYELDYQTDEPINEEIEPSERVIKNICDSEKFCNAQGKITFGQLKSIVENAKVKKLLTDVGEGGYKATLRLLPWFFPQLAVAGFTGSLIRAFNKIFRPALEDTTGYKTWWGKTIMNIFNLVEGELGITDPLSKIFFISDGLLTMLDEKEKIKFARYIAEVAAEKPDDEEVPEYFVENELRNWLNQKFLLDPPLQPKEVKGDDQKPEEEINESKSFEYQDTEEYYQKIDDLLTKFLSTFKIKDNSNFLGFKVLSGKDRYGDFTIKINGIFKEPFSMTDSEKAHGISRKMIKVIKNNFPFLTTATFHAGSTSTLGSYEGNLKWEKQYINRKVEESKLPFQEKVKNGIKRRVFNEGVDNHELKWHFDERDRKVKVVKSDGWFLQMDNGLPAQLNEGDIITIPKGVYHRVIKGNGDLIVKIKEY
jgi:hypothetical protein